MDKDHILRMAESGQWPTLKPKEEMDGFTPGELFDPERGITITSHGASAEDIQRKEEAKRTVVGIASAGFSPAHAAAYAEINAERVHQAITNDYRTYVDEDNFNIQPDGSVVVTREVYEQLVEDGYIKDDSVVSMSISGMVNQEIAKAMESKIDGMMNMNQFEPQFMNRAARRAEARSNRKKGNVKNSRR